MSLKGKNFWLEWFFFLKGTNLFTQYITYNLANILLILLLVFPATDANIIQLSAVHDDDEFNIYIIPEDKISASASQVTQLSMVRGRLFHKGKPVPAEKPKEAFQKFLLWLKAKEKQVVLLAHNAKCFDSKRISETWLKDISHTCGLWHS